MKLIIYQNSKSATQSGKSNAGKWMAKVFDSDDARFKEPLMGWISANDTSSQLKYRFASKDLAVKFAKKHNFDYVVHELNSSHIKAKSYSANFTRPIL
jgi:hypothetical protein